MGTTSCLSALLCVPHRSGLDAGTSHTALEAPNNRIQVLKTVPVNLSLNSEHTDVKRDPYTGGSGAAATVPLLKAEPYAPYRLSGEGQARGYEVGPFSVSPGYQVAYCKGEQRGSPDSTYQQERKVWGCVGAHGGERGRPEHLIGVSRVRGWDPGTVTPFQVPVPRQTSEMLGVGC